MKHFLIFSLTLSLNFQSLAYAADNACGLTKEDIDTLNLSSGVTRMGLLSNAVTLLDNPNLIKPVGDPANSLSVPMNNQAEMLGAAELAANEQTINNQSNQMVNRCNDQKALEEAKVSGALQFHSSGCTVYELINRITSMMTELDTLEKQLVEDKATQNKAASENAKRENEIKEKKEKMEKVNKDITKAIADIKKAKDELKKAQEEQAAAQKALDAANAITCGEDDDGSCASSKASAVAAAQKSLDEAKKKVAKAEKDLKKYVGKLVDYLVNKMGIETLAVMSLLSGTAQGETGSGDIHFKVGTSDYTMIDLNTTISGLTGTTAEKAKQFTDGEEVSRGTDTFFYNLVQNTDGDDVKSIGAGGTGAIDSGYVGFYSTTGEVGAEAKTTVKETLDIFANMDNGVDYIETIALAALDFNEQVTPKQVAVLEAMKTPQSRMDEMAKKMDEKNSLKEKLATMIEKSLCYLDSSLKIYQEFFKACLDEKILNDSFYKYLYNFKTDKLKQKAKEKYFSKVNYKGIQQALECYAKGGDTNSCAALENAVTTEAGGMSCHWTGAVFGPANPITETCDASKIGQTATNDTGSQQTCACATN